MTDYNTLIELLRELATDAPGHNDGCAGCGYEHNCQTEGCAILRDAMATMEQLRKDCNEECWTCVYRDRNKNSNPCRACVNSCKIKGSKWQWRGVEPK